jgi:hypothetical protein
MVRARMTHINGKPIDDMKFDTPRGQEFATATRTSRGRKSSARQRDHRGTGSRRRYGKPLVPCLTEYMEDLNSSSGRTAVRHCSAKRAREHLERARREMGQLPAKHSS